jgi:nucleotide-binding universal stress UspA family protein
MTKPSVTHPDERKSTPQDEVVFADVLCAVDGTRGSFAAVEQAAALAGPAGHLTLLAVTAVSGAGAYKSAAISPARAGRLLERAAGIADEAGVSSSQVVDPASPASQVILERASDHDLLAIGAPVSSWLGGMFIAGVAVTALGSFATPLLTARPLHGEQDFARRILVASDGLEGSDAVVELAGRLARSQDASVILLHAIGVESNSSPLSVREQTRKLELASGGAIDTQIVAGSARKVIVEASRSAGASLVVMGSRRLDGLRAFGSVSRRVVHEAPCSVLLVPPAIAN